jgi:hypothetical protein
VGLRSWLSILAMYRFGLPRLLVHPSAIVHRSPLQFAPILSRDGVSISDASTLHPRLYTYHRGLRTIRARRIIVYYRVSTARQGESGLGLEAQTVTDFLNGGKWEIVGGHTEVETADTKMMRFSSDRPAAPHRPRL